MAKIRLQHRTRVVDGTSTTTLLLKRAEAKQGSLSWPNVQQHRGKKKKNPVCERACFALFVKENNETSQCKTPRNTHARTLTHTDAHCVFYPLQWGGVSSYWFAGSSGPLNP